MEAKLIECSVCKKMMSNQADKCPHCGSKNTVEAEVSLENKIISKKSKKSKKGLIIGIIVLLVIVIVIIGATAIGTKGNMINSVKNSVVDTEINPKGMTVQEVLKPYAKDGKIQWVLEKGDKSGNMYVTAEITVPTGEKMKIVFTLPKNQKSFEFSFINFNGGLVPDSDKILDNMYQGDDWKNIYYLTYEGEISIVKNGVMDKWINPNQITVEEAIGRFTKEGNSSGIEWTNDHDNSVYADFKTPDGDSLEMVFQVNGLDGTFKFEYMSVNGSEVSSTTAYVFIDAMYSGESWDEFINKIQNSQTY